MDDLSSGLANRFCADIKFIPQRDDHDGFVAMIHVGIGAHIDVVFVVLYGAKVLENVSSRIRSSTATSRALCPQLYCVCPK